MIDDLGEHLRTLAAIEPDAPLLDVDGTWRPWSTLTTWMHQIGVALDDAGLPDDAAVGVVLRNGPESVGALAAVLGSGRCVVTLNPARPDERLAEEVEDLALGAVVLGGPDQERATVRDAARSHGIAVHVDGEQVTASGPTPVDPPRRPGIAVEMLTSGTTGPPKRVPLPAGRLLRSISAGAGPPPRLRSGTKIVWAPLAHIGGLWGVVSTLAEGRRLDLMTRFEVEGWVERVRRHQPVVTGLPPAGLQMLLEADVDPAHLASLRAVTVGTAPASPEVVEAFESTFGVPALITYGATEFAGAIAMWTLDLHQEFATSKRGSVGRARPGIELRVVDEDTGESLPVGSPGLLEVRGAGFGDGWVRTTDRARLDEDDFLYIDGRADDAIVRGGFKVSAGEVAAAIERIPGVRRAGVVARPDARLGEVPVAAVELADPSLDERTILEALRADLVAYQLPVAIVVVDELALTPTLKVDAGALAVQLGQAPTPPR